MRVGFAFPTFYCCVKWISASIRKTFWAESQKKKYFSVKLQKVTKRKQTSLNVAILTAKHFKELMTHFTRDVYGDDVQLSCWSPQAEGTGTQITWFGIQCLLRMQTICNRVNITGALRWRTYIQNAIVHCHCRGSPVERCCSENHLQANLECHELIHSLE